MKRKGLLFLVFAALVAGGTLAQKVGDTVDVFGKNYTVKEVKDGNVLLQPTPTLTVQSGGATINGAWKEDSGGTSKGAIFTIDGGNGFFTQVVGAWEKARDKKNITIGDVFLRNIKSTGNRTWSCQNQLINTSNYNLAGWADGTLTLSADGNTLTKNTPGSGTPVIIYTRMR
jgi:hypothetical protein